MHAAHLSLPGYSNNIKQTGGCSCSAPRCHHLTVMFISQYPPPDIGNSFCLVVRIFGSELKGPQFYPHTATVPSMTNLPTAFHPLSEQQPAEILPTSVEVAWPA
ncbi:hypothetical protein AVEN_168483-1 [Araneus ventricosus]|uniref:Uncharacterized protein n=1 Tax=Araneus ventricosus TaxID=182803 RepID=A0A4Y2AAB7_ARAVE|nr:hypothetical protein AVEN_168483-1 [Araneus ventricosus]